MNDKELKDDLPNTLSDEIIGNHKHCFQPTARLRYVRGKTRIYGDIPSEYSVHSFTFVEDCNGLGCWDSKETTPILQQLHLCVKCKEYEWQVIKESLTDVVIVENKKGV